jgi:hypothetical protein
MMQRRKIFKKGIMKIGKECDLLSMMNQARRSKNFLKNYLTHEQKILQKFDCTNLINGSSSSGTDDKPSDID